MVVEVKRDAKSFEDIMAELHVSRPWTKIILTDLHDKIEGVPSLETLLRILLLVNV